MKTCTKCGESKILDDFYDDVRGKQGKRSVCKPCLTIAAREQRRKNPEPAKAAAKRYRERHPEKVREWQKRDYWKHREKRMASAKNYRQENWDKAYAAIRRWKLEHRDRVLELNAAYRERNRESLAERNAAYKRANPEIGRATEQRRRARRRNAGGASYTTAQHIEWRWSYYGGLCFYCGDDANSVDHRIALANGGSHWPANLVPCCQSCNSRKGTRSESEFRRLLGGDSLSPQNGSFRLSAPSPAGSLPSQ